MNSLAVPDTHRKKPAKIAASNDTYQQRRGSMAIQCRARNGQVGTYLYPEGGLVSHAITPVFPGVFELCTWLKAHGWTRASNTLGAPYCQARIPVTPELQQELRRRWKDRNVPGYWGVNARAWIRRHLSYIRLGYADGCTLHNARREQALTPDSH